MKTIHDRLIKRFSSSMALAFIQIMAFTYLPSVSYFCLLLYIILFILRDYYINVLDFLKTVVIVKQNPETSFVKRDIHHTVRSGMTYIEQDLKISCLR